MKRNEASHPAVYLIPIKKTKQKPFQSLLYFRSILQSLLLQFPQSLDERATVVSWNKNESIKL